VSNEYIDVKISYIDELEKNTIHDYKSELHNLCLYLKNEIAIGNIELIEEHYELLINAINKNIDLINCNDIDVVAVIKTSPDATEFWKYFNENLIPMSSDQKAAFMNN
jgi:hypothetical protein